MEKEIVIDEKFAMLLTRVISGLVDENMEDMNAVYVKSEERLLRFSIPVVVQAGKKPGTLSVSVNLKFIKARINAEGHFVIALKQAELPLASSSADPSLPGGMTSVYHLGSIHG